jgi:DNA topoisomerase-3
LKKDVYSILPDGEYLIESLEKLSIAMDKYKTSEVGKALKRVFRSEMSIDDSIKLCENEIASIFKNGGADPMPKSHTIDTGEYGEILGKCPVCGKNVVRGKQSYGCMGYGSGCEFRVGITIFSNFSKISKIFR